MPMPAYEASRASEPNTGCPNMPLNTARASSPTASDGTPRSPWPEREPAASLKPAFESLVFRPEMEEYVSLAEARRLFNEHQSGLGEHSRRLWHLLMLAAWDAQRRSNRAFQLEAAIGR